MLPVQTCGWQEHLLCGEQSGTLRGAQVRDQPPVNTLGAGSPVGIPGLCPSQDRGRLRLGLLPWSHRALLLAYTLALRTAQLRPATLASESPNVGAVSGTPKPRGTEKENGDPGEKWGQVEM